MESQLVASSAARPWVPVSELRIWIYAAIIGVLLSGLTFALARPIPFRPALNPLVDHLLAGERPRLVVLVESLFLVFSTQLGLLIAWYRSQCKLDFSGRYRVWPWAAGLFSIVAITVSTNLHRVVGEVLGKADCFFWRGETVVWLLPLCVMALPITLLLDRDLRQSCSSLYTLRLSGLLWYLAAWIELFQPDLSQLVNLEVTRQVLPMFASATLFLGLWLHSRIVAYVCPDPPELAEPSAISVLLRAARWCGRRLQFWTQSAVAVDESDGNEELEKPKRRRKKVDPEEAGQKRKRKAPTKRAAPKTRAKVKPPENDETEELEEQVEEATDDTYEETDAENASYDESSTDDAWTSTETEQSEEWTEEEEVETSPAEAEYPEQSGKFVESHKSHGSKVGAPHFHHQPSSRRDEEYAEPVEQDSSSSQESSEDTDEDAQLQRDSGLTSDQMKGMSKRQKRELKKQNRDRQRGRG